MAEPKNALADSKDKSAWNRITRRINLDNLRKDVETAATAAESQQAIHAAAPFKTYHLQVHNRSELYAPVPELVQIPEDWLSIGKSPSDIVDGGICLVLKHRSVSRAHCGLRCSEGKILVKDMGSTNGTFLVRRAKMVPVGADPIPMADGDLLAVGQILCAIVVKEHLFQ